MPIGDRHILTTSQRHHPTGRPLDQSDSSPSTNTESTAVESSDTVQFGTSQPSDRPKPPQQPKSLWDKFRGLFRREPPMREWTVLYYANGNSDLEAREYEKLARLGEVGSTNTTTFVAQISQGSRDGIGQRFEIAKKSWGDVTTGPQDTKLKEELGPVNMGDGATFKDAVLWAHREYPAKQFMVILGGHGEGPRGALHDDIHGERLETGEIAEGFEALKQARGGKKTEVVVADSCLLGSGELGYQLRDSGEYFVASEEVINTSDLGFRDLGKGLRKKGR